MPQFVRIPGPALRAACFLALAGAAACAESPAAPPEPQGQVIRAAPDSLFLGYAGEMGRFAVSEKTDPWARTPGVWSTDPSVAQVVSSLFHGRAIEARGEGDAWIVVGSEADRRDSVHVRVRFPHPPQPLPVWRFTVAVGVNSTLADPEVFRAQVQWHFDLLNAGFNRPHTFSGRLEWVIDSLFVYRDSVPIARRGPDRRSAQYLLLLQEPQSTGGGSYGGRDRDVVMLTRMDDPNFDRILLHEFGHARGGQDIYFGNFVGARNPLSGLGWIQPPSIMNSTTHGWDPATYRAIERSGGLYPALPAWERTEFPHSAAVRVATQEGRPVAGAKVTLYGFRLLQTTTGGMPVRLAEGTTGADGVFQPAENLFKDPQFYGQTPYFYGCYFGFECLSVVHAVVEHGGTKTYAWLHPADAVRWHDRNPGLPYVRTIKLGDPPV